MSNSYVWTISALECVPSVDDKTDYVVVAHWRCEGADGEYTGEVYRTQSFQVNPDKPNYTPYDDLSEAEVIAWVQNAMGEDGVAAVYQSIDTQIQMKINPPVIMPPLPWS